MNGNIIRVKNVPHVCGKNQTAISWNAQGQKGDRGSIGLTGPKGDAGPTGGLYITNQDGPTSALVTNLTFDGSGTFIWKGDLYAFKYVNKQVFVNEGTVDLEIDINSTNPLAPTGDYDVLFKESDCSGEPYFYFGGVGKTLRLSYSNTAPFHDYSLISDYIGKKLIQSSAVPLSQMSGRYWWDSRLNSLAAQCKSVPEFKSRTEMVYKLDKVNEVPSEADPFLGELGLSQN